MTGVEFATGRRRRELELDTGKEGCGEWGPTSRRARLDFFPFFFSSLPETDSIDSFRLAGRQRQSLGCRGRYNFLSFFNKPLQFSPAEAPQHVGDLELVVPAAVLERESHQRHALVLGHNVEALRSLEAHLEHHGILMHFSMMFVYLSKLWNRNGRPEER